MKTPRKGLEATKAVAERLIADGRLIEGGFVAFRLAVISPDAPAVQVKEMRNAWFAGAQHVFASIMATLDEGAEPTDADMQRISNIAAELDDFTKELERRVGG